MSMDAQQIAERAAATLYKSDPASQKLGMRILEVKPGCARVSMVVTADMLNGHAMCHGGYIFTLADSAFAFACNTYNEATVAASANIDFLSSAKEGDELTADAKELWRSRRAGIYEITVTNRSGERIALFRGRSHQVGGKLFE